MSVSATPAAADAPGREMPALQLALLNGFELRREGRRVELPLASQRVVAFLALHDHPLQRVFVAGKLWIDSSEAHANASLRTALWRIRQPGGDGVVRAAATHVELAPGVEVDLRDAVRRARRALDEASPAVDDLRALASRGELLPDWYDDWVLVERERFRQLRLHALEALCDGFARAGRFAEATEAGLAAVVAEPLRESAHRALVRAHLAEGNPGEALRQYRSFRALLAAELGLEPSPALEALVAGLTRT